MTYEPTKPGTAEHGAFQEVTTDPIFEKIFQLVPQVTYVFNLQTQQNEYSNREIGKVLGYSPDEIRAAGKDFLPNVIHPDDMAKVIDHHQRLAASADGKILTIEYRARNGNGAYQTLLSRETIFDRDENGAALRMAGVAIDITDQKQAEAAAVLAVADAEAANDDLRAFTYSVSHELRSPAITVQTILNELKNGHAGPMSDDATGLVGQAIDTLERMQRTIATVLDFNRLVGSAPVREQVNLTEVAQDVLRMRAAEIAAAPAEITVGHLPTITADPEHIHILMSNLIGNAIKYKKPGEAARLAISHRDAGSATDTVQISFADQGIGLNPDFGDKIYRMFWRGHTNKEIPGSGLGLTLCHRIAKAHGGTITAEPDVKTGACFVVTLEK